MKHIWDLALKKVSHVFKYYILISNLCDYVKVRRNFFNISVLARVVRNVRESLQKIAKKMDDKYCSVRANWKN